MIICETALKNLFLEYNKEYFDDVLPMPVITFSDSYRNLGYFSCYFDNWGCYNPIIEISNVYDFTPDQMREVLVHEMLHYYLAYTGQDTRLRHGKEFLKHAKRLNAIYGLSVGERIDDTYIRLRKGKSNIRRFLSNLF